MMPNTRWRQLEELFARALELPRSERQAFIAAQTIDDPGLRLELETLLEHANTGANTSGVRQLIGDAAVTLVAATGEHHVGHQFDRYHLTSVIGEGGMGVVYMAERNDGEYKRRVAIKVVRPGMASPALVARLRDERQLLATLDHPGIVRLLDGGTTPDGLPYIVMEHVDGAPISVHCRPLSIRARVRLVAQIAEALQYAHQKLVVHRDVKPSNILVDPSGVPKLVDFGIAKVLDGSGTEREASTRAGMAMFTPEYASPEQVRGESVTVSSDVYAIGAVLYELFTGVPPQRAGTTLAETLANICNRDPVRPSLVAPTGSRRELVGDLDSVALKALQKEPRRRYQSAAQLADDLHRYLNGMPVTAHEATRRYRARKFVARHRGKLALALMVVGALATATLVSLLQARRADGEAQRAMRDKRALLRERGLQELAAKRANRALPYLVEAMREGDESTALRLLVAEAMRPYSRELVSMPIAEGAVSFALAPDESRFAVTTMSGSLILFAIDGSLLERVETSEAQRAALRTPLGMVSFSPDGRKLVARNENGTVYVWDVARRSLRLEFATTTFARASDRLLAFNLDGTAIVGAGATGAMVLVDTATGVIRSSFELAENGSVTAATSAVDARRVALGMSDGTIHVWHVDGNAQRLEAHHAAIRVLTFTKDGNELASGSEDGTVRIWSVPDNRVRYVLAQHQDSITAMELTRDEARIATGSADGTAVIWDLRTGRAQATVIAHPGNRVRSLHFDVRGDCLVTSGEDATFRVWDSRSAHAIDVVEANSGAGTAGFSAPGARDARIFAQCARLLSLEARYVKVSRIDHTPVLFDLALGFPATAAAYSPDGQEIAVVGGTQLAFWSVASRTQRLRIDLSDVDLADVAWNPHGDQIVIVGRGGAARTYNRHGQLLRALQGHRKLVRRGSWSPDGTRIVTASQDGSTRIWDAATGEPLLVLAHPLMVMAAAWRQDGTQVVTACRDGKLRIWNATLGFPDSIIDGRGTNFLDVTFSPDGSMLAATGRDGDAGIWSAVTGTRVMPLEGHTDVVLAAAWSPKGDLVATTADNGVVVIWDPGTGAMLMSRSQPGEPLGLAWSPDGTNVLVASNDGHVRAWEVSPTREPLEALNDFVVRRVPYRLVGTRIERVETR